MFNLQVLNDKEFEDLCKDLLESELGIKLQNFKTGKDQGIDLRYSTSSSNNDIVVQAKHYVNSKFSDLKHQLFNVELPKLKALDQHPQRYIIVTSLALTPKQVDEIVISLKPFIESANDVYGLNRIQSILSLNPNVIQKHYKLWLTSTSVLERILHNGAKGRSEFYTEKILKRVGLYVPTSNFQDAVNKLNEYRFIIVTGAPGIGKTTISYLLICDLLAQGYELIHISDKIKEAEDLFSLDPTKKQVFYFDDFLGSNIYDILNAKNPESALVGFIERIKSSKNKFLILTTRTTILNQAEHFFEKFRQSKFSAFAKYQIELTQYTNLDKAKILYNHLYHNSVKSEYLDEVRKDKAYLKIINHPNYSPRLIEFITNLKNYDPSIGGGYLHFVFNNLSNPHEIWKTAYETQLDDEERFLLTTIFSLGGYKVSREVLEPAYLARLKFEIDSHGHKLKSNSFNNALKKLLDGFIISERDEKGINAFNFLNPSIGDFLLNYLKNSRIEKWRVLKSSVYFEQLTYYFHPSQKDYIPFTEEEARDFYHFFNENVERFEFVGGPKSKALKEIEILKLYLSYFDGIVTDQILLGWISLVQINLIESDQLDDMLSILEKVAERSVVKAAIVAKFNEYINRLYVLCRYTDDFQAVKKLFPLYGQDYGAFIGDQMNFQVVADSVVSFFSASIYDDLNLSTDTTHYIMQCYYEGEHKTAKSRIGDAVFEDFSNFITDIGLDDHHDTLVNSLDVDESELLERVARDYQSDHDDFEGGHHSSSRSNSWIEASQIDQLFE